MAGTPADKLLALLQDLPEDKQQELLEYAEFLHKRHGGAASAQVPLEIPRPENETVVRAIKRLRETYPMLDPAKLLHETSELMFKHTMQGQPAGEVIDELEILFRRHYQRRAGERRGGPA